MDSNKKVKLNLSLNLKSSPSIASSSRTPLLGDLGRDYSRDSFDRFGDDLCEHLLSYLSFTDKIILEDVCKQWKRTIYNKQRVLRVFSVHPIEAIPHLNTHYINHLLVPIPVKDFTSGFANNMNMRTIDTNRLKSLLIKCQGIRKIEFTRVFVDSTLLDLIGQLCPNLQSIQIDIIGLDENDINSFGQKYGHNLKRIKFNNCRTFSPRDYSNKFCADFGKKMLSFCPNIKSFQCEDISIISDKRPDFLPKLESIDLRLRRSDAKQFQEFVDKYENKLKKLKLFSSEIEFQTLRNTLQQISRLRDVEDLEITFNLMLNNNGNLNTINDKLIEMAKNCSKVTRFSLNINIFMTGTEFIAGNIWECLGKFIKLRQLDVTLKLSQIEDSVEALKRLKHLTDLSIRCSKLGDPFFKDIDLFLPNLKSLSLNSDYDLSDTLLESLSKLKHLSRISLGSGHKALRSITDSGVSQLLNNCQKLRKIVFLSRPYITAQSVDKLIEFANKNSKNGIYFYSGFSRLGDETHFPVIDLNAYKNIPQNLRIVIRSVGPNFNPLQAPLIPINELAQNMLQNVHVIELNLEHPPVFPPMPHIQPMNIPPALPDIQVVFHNHPLGPGNPLHQMHGPHNWML